MWPQSILSVFERVVAPYVQLLREQGISVDFEELMRVIALYGNLPELRNILKFTRPGDFAAEGAMHEKTLPSNTNRTYTRVNRPGATRSGKDNALTQVLMGGNPQPKEQAVIGRPTG